MKKLTLLTLVLFISKSFISAQNFEALCPSTNTNGTVVAFEHFNNEIYATGFFNTVCGEPTNYIAQWNGETWIPSAIEISDPGHALKTINDQLYIAKYEESIDSNWVYLYNGNEVEKWGEGVYLTTASGFSELPNIYDIVEFNNQIVACGEFDRVGQQTIQGIMRWNGNHWEGLLGGLSSNIQNTAPVMFPHQMLVHDAVLYVSGNFRYADGIEVNGIARWDGNEWSAMGNGFNNTVYSMTVYNNEIVVGGSFTASGAQALNSLAKWDGTQWVSMGFGFTNVSQNDFTFVHTLKVINDELFIAGGLKQISYDDGSTEACGGIVKYSNQSLETFNGGVANNDIEAIAIDGQQNLLIGGGVFGNGYWGKLDLSTTTETVPPGQNLRLFPNPVEQDLQFQSTEIFTKYSIIDLVGRTMMQAKINGNTIHLNELSTGVYFLKLENETHSFSYKIIKK